jgi:hypothetical protein
MKSTLNSDSSSERVGSDLDWRMVIDLIPEKGPQMPTLSASERRVNFAEVEIGLTEESAIYEARRCL